MRLDLFYEFCQGAGYPIPHGADRQLFEDILDQAEVADGAGFDVFWSVEHHGSVEVTHMPAPEQFLTAVAMRTKQLRVGHSVVLTHPLFNHPVRLAERAAVLDNLSGGRLEMGFGRSTPREWAIFHIDGDETRPVLEEVLHLMPQIWTQDSFQYDGEYFQVAPITIVPRMLQKPHPRMWIAAGSDESLKMAGRLGVGVLSLTLLRPFSELEKTLKIYREAQKVQTPVNPDLVNKQAGAFTFVYCAPTLDEAINDGASEAAAWYMSKVYALYGSVPVREGEAGYHFARDRAAQIEAIEKSGDSPGRQVMLKLLDEVPVPREEFYEAMNSENQIVVGTPDEVIRKLEAYEGIGLDRMMCMVMGGPDLPQEKIVQSLKLMGETVIPHFHDRSSDPRPPIE